MALNIKDPEADRLAGEIAALTGDSTTRAVTVALRERRERIERVASATDRVASLRRLLETEIWPRVPARELGKPRSKAEREAILGYGPDGV